MISSLNRVLTNPTLRVVEHVVKRATSPGPAPRATEADLRRWWGEAMDYLDVDGPCQRCGTTQDSEVIRIRPNFHMYASGAKPDFARHCYRCFVAVFGGYPDRT